METSHDRTGDSTHGPDDPVIELAWTPRREDYTEAYRVRARAQHVPLKLAGLAVAALVIGLVGFATGLGLLIGLGFAGFLGMLVVAVALPPYTIRAAWRNNPTLHLHTTARVDPAVGVVASNDHSNREYPWSMIEDVREADSVFVVQMAGRPRPFFLLAKRGLADFEQLPQLRRTLLSRGSPRSR